MIEFVEKLFWACFGLCSATFMVKTIVIGYVFAKIAPHCISEQKDGEKDGAEV